MEGFTAYDLNTSKDFFFFLLVFCVFCQSSSLALSLDGGFWRESVMEICILNLKSTLSLVSPSLQPLNRSSVSQISDSESVCKLLRLFASIIPELVLQSVFAQRIQRSLSIPIALAKRYPLLRYRPHLLYKPLPPTPPHPSLQFTLPSSTYCSLPPSKLYRCI